MYSEWEKMDCFQNLQEEIPLEKNPTAEPGTEPGTPCSAGNDVIIYYKVKC